VDVGAADARPQDANQNVVDADFRYRNIFEPESRLSVSFNESFQRVPPALVRNETNVYSPS
jgi:hypothetical protein